MHSLLSRGLFSFALAGLTSTLRENQCHNGKSACHAEDLFGLRVSGAKKAYDHGFNWQKEVDPEFNLMKADIFVILSLIKKLQF